MIAKVCDLRNYAFVCCFIFIIGCQNSSVEPEEIPVYDRGYLIDYEEMGVYTAGEINQILLLAGVEHDFELNFSVRAVSAVYQTSDAQGNLLRASGAIMVPLTDNPLPLLSINHGTVVDRSGVASESPLNSVEGVVGLVAASLGYLTAVPDYIGYGVSQEMHPYCHGKSLAISIIDMIRSTIHLSEKEAITISNNLFLSGYSEGGYATLATQKEIEEYYSSEFNLAAVAPMAGPYDFAGVVDTILNQDTYPTPAYIAFVLTAYNKIYGWERLTDIFNAPYAARMPDLFDGTKTFGEINNQLPQTIKALVNPQFISDYLNGNEPEIYQAIQENTLLDWSAKTPIRFFHGDADEDVPYSNAVTTFNNLKELTSEEIDLITIAGGTHASSGIPCIIGMIDWFTLFPASPMYQTESLAIKLSR
jgi:hypothetical protein